MAKVEITDSCWLWTASHLPKGYGQFTPSGKGSRVYAHRWSWEYFNGQSIPPGLDVCHTCDVPACVRPDHLFVGSRSDNMQDAIAKGRFVKSNSLKTHCRHGHPFDEGNTRMKGSERVCLTCHREQAKLRMRRLRAMRGRDTPV